MTKHQSKIEKLIAVLCPNGVDWKTLGEIADYRRGSFPQPYGEPKWYDGLDAMPFVQVADVGENMVLVENTKQKISKLAQTKSVFVPTGTVIVTLQGSIGRVAITQYDSYLDRTLAIFESYKIKVNKKYFAYQLEKKFAIEKETARGSTIKTITKEELTKFLIPLPPLAVQEEIVKILDTFTQLEAELEAELEARKKQYEYYREDLLSITKDELEITNGIVCRTLGDICEFRYGFTDKAKDQGNVRFVRITDINENGKLRADDSKYLDLSETNKDYLLEKGDVLMARTGATYGKTMLFNEDYIAVYASFLIRIRFKENAILPAYYWHFAQSSFYWEQAKKLVGGGAQPQFNANVLKSIQIHVPSISEQERIVTILDKFDTLVNDISIGLPAEIKARRQQYEYYRGKLLTFKEYE